MVATSLGSHHRGGLLVAVVASMVGARLASAQKATTYQYGTVRQGNLALTVSGTGPVQADLYNSLIRHQRHHLRNRCDRSGRPSRRARRWPNWIPRPCRTPSVRRSSRRISPMTRNSRRSDKCNSSSNPPVDCVQLAENQYASAAQQLATAKGNLANATLKATHAGVVTAINGAVGSAPGSGSSGSSTSSSSSSGFIQIADNSSSISRPVSTKRISAASPTASRRPSPSLPIQPHLPWDGQLRLTGRDNRRRAS